MVKPSQPNELEADAFNWPTLMKTHSRVAEKELPPIWYNPFPSQFLPNALWVKNLNPLASYRGGVISMTLLAFQSCQETHTVVRLDPSLNYRLTPNGHWGGGHNFGCGNACNLDRDRKPLACMEGESQLTGRALQTATQRKGLSLETSAHTTWR